MRATSARGGCGSGSQLPTMVWRPGAGRVPRPPWATAGGGGRARHLGTPGRARTQGPGTGGRCRRPPTRSTCCAGGGWEPRDRGAPPAASPGPGGGAQGGVPFMGRGSWAPPRAISASASSAGNSRQRRLSPRQPGATRSPSCSSSWRAGKRPSGAELGAGLAERRKAWRLGPAPFPRALCSQTLSFLPPPHTHTRLPPLCLLSLPFSPLYAILRD